MNPPPIFKSILKVKLFHHVPFIFRSFTYLTPQKEPVKRTHLKVTISLHQILRVPISNLMNPTPVSHRWSTAPDWIDFQPSNKWIRWPDQIVSTWNIMHHTSEPELFKGKKKIAFRIPSWVHVGVKNCLLILSIRDMWTCNWGDLLIDWFMNTSPETVHCPRKRPKLPEKGISYSNKIHFQGELAVSFKEDI